MTLFYTREEIEAILVNMSTYIYTHQMDQYRDTILKTKRSGISFIVITWNDIRGSYFGNYFRLKAYKDDMNNTIKHVISWHP